MKSINDLPFWNSALPLEERVRDLRSRLTIDEKVAQLIHDAPAIERLGIPAYNWWNECLHGVARAGKATVFPQAIGMAATFNTELIHRVASAISDEARAKHHDALRLDHRGQYFGLTYWTPNINIFRDPRWGRGQETYGEDPYLTARMGVAFITGLQGDHPHYLKLVATPKHFAVHSGPEHGRHSFDVSVSMIDLHGTYLPAFKACIQEAKAFSVMGAYNRLFGEPCCGSEFLLQKTLRESWGFQGYVVSDCGGICDFHLHHRVTATAAESAAMAIRNGCDLNCGETYRHARAAVQAGLLSEAEIDRALDRLLTARFRLGMFDPPDKVPYASIPACVVNCDEHQDIALRVARESFVLLKNDGPLLPLSKSHRCIAVVGPSAYSLDALHGNYTGYSPRMITFLEGLLDALPSGTQVNWARGCDYVGSGLMDRKELGWTIDTADIIIACLGNNTLVEGEEGDAAGMATTCDGDRREIGLPGRQLDLLKLLCSTGKPVVLVLTGGSPIELNWATDNVPAILMTWYSGERGGKALADVLFGDYSPAGRLPVTFVRSLDQLPPFENYDMAGRTYRFMSEEPLYRFGYGLSYTTFCYSNFKLNQSTMFPDTQIECEVMVENCGNIASDEVVQLYLRDDQSSVPVPRHQLKRFARIHLRPGETKSVQFKLNSDDFAWPDLNGAAHTEPGTYTIFVGGTQPDDPTGRPVCKTIEFRC